LDVGEDKLADVLIDLDGRWVDIEDIDLLLFELQQAQKQLLDDLGSLEVHLVSLTNDGSEADGKMGELEHDHAAILEELLEAGNMIQFLLLGKDCVSDTSCDLIRNPLPVIVMREIPDQLVLFGFDFFIILF
jgi:hypothetical protein